MNRRQQPAPPRPQQPQRQQRAVAPPQQQQQQQPQRQSRQQPQQSNTPRQLPSQVSIPQAISILVARINQLEDRCGVETNVVDTTDTTSEQMEEMTKRIVKLELELVTAKDIILKLQSFAINNATTAKQIVDVAGSV